MIIDQAKLKDLLKKKGLTKSALCVEIGISSRTIAKIGKGEDINDKVVKRIAEYLCADCSEITKSNEILDTLRKEMRLKLSGGLYHETQIKLTYNSNRIEGSKLTEEQTRYIFETKTIGVLPSDVQIDDIIETNNHFRCIDYVIERATEDMSEDFVLTLQRLLKEGTEHAKIYGSGKYKTLPNTVGGIETSKPIEVAREMKDLIAWYNSLKKATFEDIVEFHYRFETIHPFQDGNGRTGRLILFRECLKADLTPVVIEDKYRTRYIEGLKEYRETGKTALLEALFTEEQKEYAKKVDYFLGEDV